MAYLMVAMCVLASCTSQPETANSASATPAPTPTPIPTAISSPESPDQDQVAYMPAGQPGSATSYAELVDRLSAIVPIELRDQVPWPNLRDPVDVIDQDTGAIVRQQSGIATRVWLSIMVPTDVGWQLWRDQLIEADDAQLQVPDVPPPPGPDVQPRSPEV